MYATQEYYIGKIAYLESKANKVEQIKSFIDEMKSIKYVPTSDYIFDEIMKIINKDIL